MYRSKKILQECLIRTLTLEVQSRGSSSPQLEQIFQVIKKTFSKADLNFLDQILEGFTKKRSNTSSDILTTEQIQYLVTSSINQAINDNTNSISSNTFPTIIFQIFNEYPELIRASAELIYQSLINQGIDIDIILESEIGYEKFLGVRDKLGWCELLQRLIPSYVDERKHEPIIITYRLQRKSGDSISRVQIPAKLYPDSAGSFLLWSKINSRRIIKYSDELVIFHTTNN